MQAFGLAPINRLPLELIAEIMFQGLPSPLMTDPRRRWTRTLLHLRRLGAISSAWRKARDNSAILWTFIYYRSPLGFFHNPTEIFNLFLLRSKGALLELHLDLRSIPRLMKGPLHCGDSRSIHPILYRCRSLSIIGDKDIVEPFFPLPSNMPALRIFNFSEDNMRPEEAGEKFGVKFFEDGTNARLTALSLTRARVNIPLISNVVTRFIKHLSFEEHITSLEALTVAAQCPLLETLHLGDVAGFSLKSTMANMPAFTFPYLVSLRVTDAVPPVFPNYLRTPELRTLHIKHSWDGFGWLSECLGKPSQFPHLQALSLEAVHSPNVDILAYIGGISSLRLLDFQYCGWANLFKALRSASQNDNLDGLPRLDWVRFCVDETFAHVAFEILLQGVLLRRPKWMFEVHYTDNAYDSRRREPNITNDRLIFTRCSDHTEQHCVPNEKVLAIERDYGQRDDQAPDVQQSLCA